MYFVMRLSKTPAGSGAFIDSVQYQGEKKTDGIGNGLYLQFDMQQNETLELQTGLSYTSIENARLNLETETQNLDFDQVRTAARDEWNAALGRIKVEGGKLEDRIKFYTGLYHVLLGRGLASDVDGSYPMVDNRIGQTPLDENGLPKYNHYNTDGIWGGFWNLTQVWSLAYPDYFSDYVQSNIDFYKDRGWLHDGQANGVFTNGVQTNFQGLVIASAYNLGIRDFDVQTGYEAALKNELDYHGRDLGNGKYDLSYFVKNGYVPYKDTVISNGWVFNFGASHTLEYSFSSFAVSQMAKHMNDTLHYHKLLEQADNWRNLFDSNTKLIRPKLESGEFIPNFDPAKAWDGFQEGNAYQYTWYVPHDVEGLLNSIGPELFNERLEQIFQDAAKNEFGTAGDEIASFSGIEQLYNHGNQPSLHNAWLFNLSGKPWLTQKWVRTLCDQFYGTTPLHGYGVGQDEDQGQLGGWYVMAAMGLFDVKGLTDAQPSFQFSAPIFDRITINLHPDYYEGESLVISKEGSPADIYIGSVAWNGSPLDRYSIYHNQLVQGGELKFNLVAEPAVR